MAKDKKPLTELEKLKAKCLKKDGQPRMDAKGPDLARLKILQDAEPLTAAEIEESKKREAVRVEKEKTDYKERMAQKADAAALGQTVKPPDTALDRPPIQEEHPRIKSLKEALQPFSLLEIQESRPDDFIILNTGNSGKGGCITAGDVRTARRALDI